MHYYPLFMDLSEIKVFIAGAGEVGRRKAADILACGPRSLLWIDPCVTFAELPLDFQANKAVRFEQREARPEDVHGCGLVFAATDSREANRALAKAAAAEGIPCNVADAPDEGSFIVPSHFSDGNFSMAISTGGASPVMAKIIRQELESWYTGRYRALLNIMASLRPLVLALGSPTERNTELFRTLSSSGLGEALGCGDTDKAREILTEHLPPVLHANIEDLLNAIH